MKRSILFFTIVLFYLFANAVPERNILNGGQSHPGRDANSMYPDMPEAYYEYNIKTQEITIDGNGSVSYYDVEISSPVTNTVEISTQVDGTYDTLSISSLPTGTHVITITSPSGNVFEGTFTIY